MADDAVTVVDETTKFETLPDDLLRTIWERLRARCEEKAWAYKGGRLRDAFRFFAVCQRCRGLSVSVERLRVGMMNLKGQLQLPNTILTYHQNRTTSSLLAPYGWAARLPNLKELRISHLSWGGAARLVTLLPAWPALEQLDIQFSYDFSDLNNGSLDTSCDGPYQHFANDLAASLKLGVLPRLQFLYIGNLGREHSFGQRYDDQDERGKYRNDLDDTVVLEQLKPTAAVWWMAERAQHVRKSKMHQFKYEIEHGANLKARFAGHTLLSWMRERLGVYYHSMRGHQLVHELLVEAGAEPEAFRPLDVEGWGGPRENWGSDEYDTDYEERVGPF